MRQDHGGFLVLSRKADEEIKLFVGQEEITIRVCEVGSGKVRIGIRASKQVLILRDDAKQRQPRS